MIAKLRGIIDTLGENSLILDVNGVGYQIGCSQKTLLAIGSVGDPATLFIETVMRQESLQLYGFQSVSEKGWFHVLTTVQGVGMKVAMAILSALNLDEIHTAILQHDKATITRAEGVGPKLAARILNELKEKIPTTLQIASSGSTSRAISPTPIFNEALMALMQLGYRRAEATEVLREITAASDDIARVEDLVRMALGKLSTMVA